MSGIQELVDAIEREAIYLGDGIVKVDGLVNHKCHPAHMTAAAAILADRFGAASPTKILTAESSGIPPAFAAAVALGVPMVYARKRRPITMADPVLTARAPSRTRGGDVELTVAGEYLRPDDRILIVDDFLGSGRTACALVDIVRRAGAAPIGVACLVAKDFDAPVESLDEQGVPVTAIVRLYLEDGRVRAYAPQ